MKTVPAFLAALVSALLLPSSVDAQMPSHPAVARAARAPVIESTPARARAPEARAQDSTPRFQMIGFKFWTGGDDLRDDSAVKAVFVFPDRTRQECRLHGTGYAAGAAANISWDNSSIHDAAPCKLARPRTLAELKRPFVFVLMTSNALSVDPVSAVAGGPVGAAASLRTNDNWDIARGRCDGIQPGLLGWKLRGQRQRPSSGAADRQPDLRESLGISQPVSMNGRATMNTKILLATATAALALCCTRAAPAASSGACALLTTAQVSSALGVPMSASSFGADARHCQWQQRGNDGKQPANAVLLIESAQTYDMLKRLRESGNSSLFVPAAGIGDDAFYWGGALAVTLFVKKGGTGFRVVLSGGGWSIQQIKAREKTLAQAVLSKL